MVYPALTYLEEIGNASVATEGPRKRYEITDAGRAHLEGNRNAVDTMLAQLKWVGDKMEHLRGAFSNEGDPADDRSPQLREARSRLRAALIERRGASDEEQRRIAGILERATKEIRGK
jgi:DNA-binding PadR family transcriptional regulator